MNKCAKAITIIVVSGFLFFANLAVTTASDDEIIQYHLDSAKVTDARLHKWGEELSVQVTLDGAETVRFAKLTKHNVGKRLQVLLDDQVLIEAVVRAEIDSGSMSVRVSDEAEAEQFMQALKPREQTDNNGSQ